MKIDNIRLTDIVSNQQYNKLKKEIKSNINTPKDSVQLRSQKYENFRISKNDPTDPTVSTKILNSLNSGYVNFDQNHRDVIASILNENREHLYS
jgi:hypothetical protein